MKIKRELELFWIKHGGRILSYVAICGAVILVTQILNHQAEKKLEEEKQKTNEDILAEYIEESKQIREKYENTAYIKEFIALCNEETLEEAYNMLSEKCKTEKYKTLDSFRKNYYKKFFLGEYTYEKIEFNSKDNTYTLTFYESALLTGSLEKRKSITSKIKVEEMVLDLKIYIIE